MFEKEIAELAIALKDEDLERLEKCEQDLEASLKVEYYIRSEMSKKKNQKMIDSYRQVLTVVERDKGGHLLKIHDLNNRIKDDYYYYYEFRARRLVLAYYAGQNKETLSK